MYIRPQLFNPIYEEVRKLRVYYEIKESAGATVIKISVEKNKTFRQKRKV